MPPKLRRSFFPGKKVVGVVSLNVFTDAYFFTDGVNQQGNESKFEREANGMPEQI